MKERPAPADNRFMSLPSRAKHFFAVLQRVIFRRKAPAKRRDFRVLGTIECGDAGIPAVMQNISATGLCFVIQESSLPEEFMVRLQSPLERKERRLRCRRVWAKRFEAEGRPFLRVGCAFNDHSFRLRWLSNYLADDFTPHADPSEVEAA